MKKLKDCADPVKEFLCRAHNLGPAIGPILYQLPPRWTCNVERLEAFVALLPRDHVHVFEFREKSWICEDVLALLDRSGVSFCVHDMAGSATGRWAAGPIAYVRFHGGVGKYWGRYADADMQSWADWAVDQLRDGRSVWFYFNNDIHGHAIDDARTLKAMVEQ
jgi:uncharacterized protein YecE (DUF72 family)